MIARCYQPNHRSYPEYGGRGIRVYFDWCGRGGFRAFLRDMGKRPAGHEIDRLDPDKGYEPGNVRWHPAKDNAARARRTHCTCGHERTALDASGTRLTMSLAAWAEHIGIPYKALLRRLQRGWGDAAFSTPRGARRATVQRRLLHQELALMREPE